MEARKLTGRWRHWKMLRRDGEMPAAVLFSLRMKLYHSDRRSMDTITRSLPRALSQVLDHLRTIQNHLSYCSGGGGRWYCLVLVRRIATKIPTVVLCPFRRFLESEHIVGVCEGPAIFPQEPLMDPCLSKFVGCVGYCVEVRARK